MAWSNSKVFAYFVHDAITRTAAFDLDGAGEDTFKVALYNNSITPDNTVAASATAYNTGQWSNTNEVSDNADGWANGGLALGTPVASVSTTTIKWDGDDRASTTSSVTLTNATGALIYDDTLTTPVADQGVCYNYFGGVNSVTDGTFTIVWSASGIMSFSVA